MLKYCLKKWEANKGKLELSIRNDTAINDCQYSYLVKKVITYILNDGFDDKDDYCKWNSDRVIETGGDVYQGTLVYLIPRCTYSPTEYEYLMTYVDYGSCSGCDTLLYIQNIDYDYHILPTEDQVKEYMTLCMHLVQNIIKPYNSGWRADEEFTPVEI